jgi:hypothetical protein
VSSPNPPKAGGITPSPSSEGWKVKRKTDAALTWKVYAGNTRTDIGLRGLNAKWNKKIEQKTADWYPSR